MGKGLFLVLYIRESTSRSKKLFRMLLPEIDNRTAKLPRRNFIKTSKLKWKVGKPIKNANRNKK